MKVYLSGGMHSNWREEIIASLPEIAFFDPSAIPEELGPELYTLMEAAAIASSDIVLAYMDTGNPSGFGMSLEVGLAVAQGIPVLFVDGVQGDKRFDMHRVLAAETLPSIQAAIEILGAVYDKANNDKN